MNSSAKKITSSPTLEQFEPSPKAPPEGNAQPAIAVLEDVHDAEADIVRRCQEKQMLLKRILSSEGKHEIPEVQESSTRGARCIATVYLGMINQMNCRSNNNDFSRC